MNAAARVLGKTINAALFAGDGTSNTIAGIAVGVDDLNTNDYAGIDVSTQTWWTSAALGTVSSESEMALADFDTFHGNIFSKFGQPLNAGAGDIFLTTQALYAKYQSLVGANPRQIVNQGGTTLAGGATGLEHDGVPIIRDGNCTALRVYGLRKNCIRLDYLPVMQVNGMPVQNDRDMTTGTLGQDEPSEVMIHINELGRAGAAIKFQVWVQLQLRVIDRFAHGVWRVTTS